MIKRIKEYKRYEDYYSLISMEVKSSLLLTLFLTMFLLVFLNFYNEFFEYQEDVKQLLTAIIGGEFGLLGMSLAGMAIITSLFSPETLKLINKIDKNDVINRLLSQFEFSAFNLGFQISYLIIFYFAISSNRNLVNVYIFFTAFVLTAYHFFFNLFYIIALIGNCIEINVIKNSCDTISLNEKTRMDIANEIRIDYILAVLLKDKGFNREQLKDSLNLIIDKSNISDKESVKEYFKSYYSGNSK